MLRTLWLWFLVKQEFLLRISSYYNDKVWCPVSVAMDTKSWNTITKTNMSGMCFAFYNLHAPETWFQSQHPSVKVTPGCCLWWTLWPRLSKSLAQVILKPPTCRKLLLGFSVDSEPYLCGAVFCDSCLWYSCPFGHCPSHFPFLR